MQNESLQTEQHLLRDIIELNEALKKPIKILNTLHSNIENRYKDKIDSSAFRLILNSISGTETKMLIKELETNISEYYKCIGVEKDAI